MEPNQLAPIISGVYRHYLNHGCPCRFPRFRKLVSFNFDDFGIGPTACLESHMLLDLAFRGPKKVYRPVGGPASFPAGNHWIHKCDRCGSDLVEHYDEYSINMFREYAVFTNLTQPDLGARTQFPIPIVNGFFGFSPNEWGCLRTQYAWPSPVDDFVTYMTAPQSDHHGESPA